jgi:anti-sigma B factor antagonist
MDGEMAMRLSVDTRDDVVIVTPSGRIAEVEAHQLEKELLVVLEQGARILVIDLAETSFVTSACLGALMMAHKQARKVGGGLRVARPQPLVRQILEITKLTKLFGLYGSVDEAIDAS